MQSPLIYEIPSLNQALEIHLFPFLCVLKQKTNNQIVWLFNSVEYRDPSDGWHQSRQTNLIKSTELTCSLDILFDDQSILRLEVFVQKTYLNFHLRSEHHNPVWIEINFSAQQDEHFVGFGERFDSIDQRGKQLTLWVEDGATMGLTYIPVPFYMSSCGYGLLLDTTSKCIARMAMVDDPNQVSLRVASPNLSFTVFLGNSMKEILSQYTEISGRPDVPPEWVFGPWKSRDWQMADQHGILEDIDQQIELGLPSTVKLIDARWEEAYHSFRFDPKKFPDPKAMIDAIHANGNKLMLWITPWMAVDNYTDPNNYYDACAERGYFLRTPVGKIYVSQMGMNPMLVGSCIDFTNPAAVAWYQEQLRYLIDLGVDAFQTDFGEQVPEDSVFFDGRTGKEMHNLYPVLYNEITYQTLQAVKPGALLIRSGWHGSQKYSVIWAGDQTSDFCLNSGMHSAMIAGQTAGLSGFPFWASDIGGYFGNPTDEVYMRWTQLGAFSPVMMLHGAGKREPWYFSDSALENYRKFAGLHTDLFPYIYSYAQEASKTGIPILRAMVLEFEKEPGIWRDLCEDQFCFGANLLVAPIHYGFSRERPVFLPAGLWRDFWTGKLLEGGKVVVCHAEVHQIPIFAKAGAIIPKLDPTPQTLVKCENEDGIQASGNLRVDVYPGANGEFALYDGTIFIWEDNRNRLIVINSPVERFVSVRLVDGQKGQSFKVTCNGQQLPIFRESLAKEKEYTRVKITNYDVIFTLV
jgi:alpha-D-xyloside xylohydrolase